jgi:phage shock protein E
MRILAVMGVFLVAGLAGFVVLRSRASSRQAHKLVGAGAALVDVRTPAEFDAGHLPGAINIPVAELDARAHEIGPVDRPVVTYCRSGVRSARAAATLTKLGWKTVVNLGPKAAW